MKKLIKLIFGIIACLVGLGFVFPAVAQLRTTGALPAMSVGLLFLGTALTLSGLVAGVLAFKSP